MTKTLADMTAEERAQCRGMWCDFPDPDERTNLAIYVGDSLKHHGFCELIHEGQLGTLTIPETLTPRFDLPRVWTPDGEPVNMNKVYGQCETGGTPDGSFATIVHTGAGTEYATDDTPHGEVYRWVGDWEQVE